MASTSVRRRIRYENPAHAVADPFVGLYRALFRVASPQRLVCARCGVRRDYMTARQRQQRAAGEAMVCGRRVIGRWTCPGHLIRVEVTR